MATLVESLSFSCYSFPPFYFVVFGLLFPIVFVLLSLGTMRARLLLSNGGETVACCRCDGGGHFGTPLPFPHVLLLMRGLLEALSAPLTVSPCSSSSAWVVGGLIGAPYRLLAPSFGAMVVVFRSWRDTFRTVLHSGSCIRSPPPTVYCRPL